MRICVIALALFAAGCEHWTENARKPEPVSPPGVGETHTAYRGKPVYLAAGRPLRPVARPATPEQNPCAQRSRVCDDRLRAQLAAIDGQVLALTTPPTENQLTALKLSLTEMQ